MRTFFPRTVAVAVTWALALLGGAAQAQEAPFPSKPVRFVIPTAAGGSLDVLARLVAEKVGAAWGQPVIVESRAGANSIVATSYVAKSAPDGYTALFTLSGFVQNLVLQANPPYKAADLVPVSLVAWFPIALAANADLPARDLGSVVALARRKPGALSFGSYGAGSAGHIIGEGLNKAAGMQIKHVAYKGEAAAFPDLASGQIELAYGSVGFYARQAGTGRVRILAVANPQRLKTFPDVPTLAEAGYPDVNLPGWGGVFLPAGTPQAIVDKFEREVRRVTLLPDVQARILELGFEPVGSSAAEFSTTIAEDLQKWGAVVRANNIKLE
ncbi:MAG: tripartite tricarboxylate transporter substrate binding protein [Variovorax paradoxus]|nr:MAG: tripartite tricarboxylate transporter substrate binding protein [Variovorax paradoxus]PZQ15591.1 MAG: tripartite tricarboxylate transporter substrate binding protein [Variovorax paradoxus]